MVKIKKNLSDSDMLKGWQEQTTFETETLDEPARQAPGRFDRKEPADDINSAYLTPELKEQIGKALLELKLKLYKEGIVDYQIKVSSQDKQVLLTAVPVKAKTGQASKQPVQRTGKLKG
ncbi:hypothetical protein [Sporomusa acidovorans]|uniref:Uncharacterized protein n=1 Tax=Sporomusa acidovorans (strain ATCC 49682 / DSM 3132 / Mol) TaxID=1123286 RepID=A0ABZ3IWB6_SPOA4|nr:hypothetical protein [Sporomusa acidovorans]OZC23591.1 hypothetical protein SPACI_04930 [Sporomusa acidovorans DSM 3132]SDE21885.1 hypothetical protein SAMN04488499_101017 [Sporomusa acidovorans]